MNNFIAIGINKLDKIWNGHFGISPYFQIYNRDGEMIDKRINPHGAGEKHKHSHNDDKPFLIKEILHDCNIFVGAKMGAKSKLKLEQKLGVKTILTDKLEPKDVVYNILDN